jgi:RHS repeat-associated protein
LPAARWAVASALTASRLADAPGEIIDSRFHAIVSDLVGTPTELVGPDGRVSWYHAESLWGEEIAVRGSDGADRPLRFPGQYHDRETGLHYNFHRYYDPATARYLSPDPLGFGPAANNYTYVVNPMVVYDPFGLAGYRGADGRYAVDPSLPSNSEAGRHQYPSGRRAHAAPGHSVRRPHLRPRPASGAALDRRRLRSRPRRASGLVQQTPTTCKT